MKLDRSAAFSWKGLFVASDIIARLPERHKLDLQVSGTRRTCHEPVRWSPAGANAPPSRRICRNAGAVTMFAVGRCAPRAAGDVTILWTSAECLLVVLVHIQHRAVGELSAPRVWSGTTWLSIVRKELAEPWALLEGQLRFALGYSTCMVFRFLF